LLLIPALNLKATLAQTTQNQPSSPLIIMKKSPAIIVTGNSTHARAIKGRENFLPLGKRACALVPDCPA